MDDNVMRVLQLLQDGKISAQEAEFADFRPDPARGGKG